MCTERKATGEFVLADFLCDNGLSHISNRPRVAYLALVTLVSHGTDFSDSELT